VSEVLAAHARKLASTPTFHVALELEDSRETRPPERRCRSCGATAPLTIHHDLVIAMGIEVSNACRQLVVWDVESAGDVSRVELGAGADVQEKRGCVGTEALGKVGL
jgi:hypothetical protein